MPQEAMVEVHKQEKKLLIGIPKETSFQENRIPLVPEAVAQLTANGHEIIIEAGAGAASNFRIPTLAKQARALFTPWKRSSSATSF